MEERSAKQIFLAKEIIEKGYDGDLFMSYCESFKGTDVDDYTLQELRYIVVQFTKAHRLAIQSPDLPSAQDSSLDVEAPENTKSEVLTHIERKDKTLAYSKEAAKMQDNDLSQQETITVTVKEVEAVSQGIFSFTKYFYPVETLPLAWIVKRSLEDFTWLRQILSTSFPMVYLPVLPSKKSKNTVEANTKQQYFLEKFLNCTLRNPLLRRSFYLQAFLMEADNKTFADIKKQSTKEKKFTSIEEFWTLDGTLICDPIIDDAEKVSINEYLNVVETMKLKLKRQSDVLIAALKDISSQILDIAKSFETLENVQKFVPDITGTSPLYDSLKMSFVAWSEHQHKCADLIQEHFSLFFKYGYKETIPLKEMIKERDSKFESFEKANSRFLLKKEKLWASGDANRWGLNDEDMKNASVLKGDKNLAFDKMLKGESVEIEKIKDEFAYFNFQAKSELRRFLLDSQLLENLHFFSFARAICAETTNIHVGWGELIASLSRIRSENIPSRSYILKTS